MYAWSPVSILTRSESSLHLRLKAYLTDGLHDFILEHLLPAVVDENIPANADVAHGPGQACPSQHLMFPSTTQLVRFPNSLCLHKRGGEPD